MLSLSPPTAFTYNDQRGWLTRVLTSNGSGSLLDQTYARNAIGRISGINPALSDATSWSYGYDDLDQLLSATNAGNGSLSRTFTYDSIGNMLSNSGVGSYTYPAAGAARPHAVISAGGSSLVYDDNGNMTSGLGRTIRSL